VITLKALLVIFSTIALWGIFLPYGLVAQPPIPDYTLVESPTDTLSQGQRALLLDLLDTSLHALADTERRGRKTGGFILLGLGSAMVIGGGVTLAVSDDKDTDIVGYSLLGSGAFLGGLSLLPFRIISQSERNYQEFRRMSVQTSAQVQRKYLYWDRRFEEIAQQAKVERIIGGTTLLVVGGVTSLLLEDSSNRERLHTFLWPAIGGVTSLLVKSETELRYQTYQRSKLDILAESHLPTSSLEWRFGINSFGYPSGSIQLNF
jgi:hypothetical protein